MAWIFAAVGLATAGLIVLGVLAVRVSLAARALSREIGRTSQRLTPALVEFRADLRPIRPPQG
jgi:uncharacterized membrane protein YciS (DUF1049 family)